MIFIVTSFPQKTPKKNEPKDLYPFVILMEDSWNDFGYMTVCTVHVVPGPDQEPNLIGNLRVMYSGLDEKKWVFRNGPNRFRRIDEKFCSLATNLEFYYELQKQGNEFAIEFLTCIRDASYNPKIWKLFSADPCFQTSLLRDRSIATEIRETVPQLFSGRKHRYVTKFDFYTQILGALNKSKITFDFRRMATSTIPNRVMLIVGTNGAGKTQFLANLAVTLSGFINDEEDFTGIEASEKRTQAGHVQPAPSFYAVVAISFNAFDKFEIPKTQENAKYSYTYCGIRRDEKSFFDENDLVNRIQKTIDSMDQSQNETFSEALKNVLGFEKAGEFLSSQLFNRYKEMSAGQRIVLNILSHLIANLKKRTLVLFDEPETHLHPSLMTTLVSEMFMLLEKYDSFAIIATHSPIIAQQIPSASIRVISRNENRVEVTLPDIECFGESLSEISNALFDVREYERDYTSIIDQLLKVKNYDPEKVEELFPNGLGSNARIYLWATARERKK